ncbi:MAG TPA: hypothetical protein VM735_05860 [Candidatus Kapabacteria bacterium]|nr:hypothetical protein [Candidatus Kapabacteria bacterium]
MKRKHLALGIAALVAAGGLWFARSAKRSDVSASDEPSTAYFQTLDGQPKPEQMTNSRPQHAPPNPTLRFRDFTPEQRVQQARKGHGPGG